MNLFTRSISFALVLLTYGSAFSQISFTQLPANMQLYPRDVQDSGTVIISGNVTGSGHDSIVVELYKNNVLLNRSKIVLQSTDGAAPFSLTKKIHAELSEYKFLVYLDNTVVVTRDSVVCGDAFLMSGQSNAIRGAKFSERNQWIRTFGNVSSFVESDSLKAVKCVKDTLWGIARSEGNWNLILSSGLTGYLVMRKILNKQQIPVCIINGGVGGTAIESHLRNNSDPLSLLTIYGRLLFRATKSGIKDHAKALLWHQGEGNMNASASNYAANFTTLHNEWKEDFPALRKFYVYQLEFAGVVQEYQRGFGTLFGDVTAMSTNGFSDFDGVHYDLGNGTGYFQMADVAFPLIDKDLYGSVDTFRITAPNLKRAYFNSSLRNAIVLEFDQPVLWPNDSLGVSMKNYFDLDNVFGLVDSGYSDTLRNSIVLKLVQSTTAMHVSYLRSTTNRQTNSLYNGPWLRGTTGLSAFSFYNFPVDTFIGTGYENKAPTSFLTRDKVMDVSIKIYDTQGRLVKTFVGAPLRSGYYSKDIKMNGLGNSLANGVYLCRMQGANYNTTAKIVIIR